jgi:putative ABC transport system substrate-binding protein
MSDMRQREFITLLGSAAVAWPLAASAQQLDRVRQISVLMGVSASDSDARPRIAAFEQTLQDLGWISSRNIRIDYRWPAEEVERLQKLAKDAVASGSEIVAATGTAWVAAVLRETSTTPIVFVLVSDPVENGFVASLSQPGGNVTGFSNADIDVAISALGYEPGGGLVVMSDQFLTVHRELIVTLAAKHHVPAIYPFRSFVTNGGLMSYGVSTVDLYRRSASYVDRILRGEKPGELPVQGPTRFELAINLTAAKAPGLEVPPVLLATADEVIE